MADNSDVNRGNLNDGNDRVATDSNNAYDQGISIGSIFVIAAMICGITLSNFLNAFFSSDAWQPLPVKFSTHQP